MSPAAPAAGRFVIVCPAGSGSTLLVRTLRTHPRLRVHGEVYGQPMVGLDAPLAALDAPALAALEALRFSDPAAALARFFAPHGAEAAGFKLKYEELVQPAWAPVLARLQADRALHVVFLDRRDLLARYVSHQIVLRQTGITLVPAGQPVPAIAPFAVDVDDLRRDIAETRRRTAHFAQVFAAQPSLRIAYEDLAADPQATCDRIARFLGVAPAPVRVATEKIVRQPPQALLLNYPEVAAALAAADG